MWEQPICSHPWSDSWRAAGDPSQPGLLSPLPQQDFPKDTKSCHLQIPETTSEHLGHDVMSRWKTKSGQRDRDQDRILSKGPHKSGGAGAQPRRPHLPPQHFPPQHFPARFEALFCRLGDKWRKMQSNQLSDVVIIKITTTPISAWFPAFHLRYLACPHSPVAWPGKCMPLSLVLPRSMQVRREEGTYLSSQRAG